MFWLWIAGSLLLPPLAWGESAVLECTMDARQGETYLFQFRLPLVEGWRITKATLLLRPADESASVRLFVSTISQPWMPERRVALGSTSIVIPRDYGSGWIRLDLDPGLIRPNGLAIRGRRFHDCQSVQHSPYLLIEGKSPAKRHSR